MKRIIALAMAVLLVAALFTGCSGSSASPAGTYKLDTINGMTIKEYFEDVLKQVAELFGGSVEELGLTLDDIGVDLDSIDFSIELKADGTLESKSNLDSEDGELEVLSGTWKQDGEKITLTIDGESEVATFKDGKLTIVEGEGDETMTMVLVKK